MSQLLLTVECMTPITAVVLAFESRTWLRPGAKDQAIRDVFGLSAARYYQALNQVIDDPEALVLDPVTTNRLRRLRETRRRARVS